MFGELDVISFSSRLGFSGKAQVWAHNLIRISYLIRVNLKCVWGVYSYVKHQWAIKAVRGRRIGGKVSAGSGKPSSSRKVESENGSER